MAAPEKTPVSFFDQFIVSPGDSLDLQDIDTGFCGDFTDKKQAKHQLEKLVNEIAGLQELFFADNRHAMLIIFQAMDTAGKDGAIKYIFSGMNPQGCRVTSFKHPNSQELEHDYLWRHAVALPERGQIGIFNRSHYENVLICKVHPHLNLAQRIPGIKNVDDIKPALWEARYRQIRDFERNLSENGTVVLKFFLHISKKEQKQRLLARINDPQKHWKFSYSDIQEREYWDQYMEAYTEALEKTSSEEAPWFVIPSDHKWFSRIAIASIILKKIKTLDMAFPVADPKELAKLEKAKQQLRA